ncbi:MAG: glycine cleavage system protein R [bacterium]
MESFAIITAYGNDRVGLADDISMKILTYDCNIEESKMAVLGGAFAVVVLVSGPETQVDRLVADAPGFGEDLGMTVAAQRTVGHQADATGRPYMIESTSLDTPGIVHAITSLLRDNSINVEDLETETSRAPFTGAPMFHMRIRAVVPQTVRVQQLKERLEDIALERDLDVSISPIRPAE